jgi:serine phosphatase RsbU (regulator of sigma subunit)
MQRLAGNVQPTSLRLLTGVLYLVALLAISGDLSFNDPAGAILLVIFVAVSSWKSFPTSSIGFVNLNFGPILAAILLYPPLQAAWIAGIGTSIGLLWSERRSMARVLRSIGAFGIQTVLAGWVFSFAGGTLPFVFEDYREFLALVPALTVYLAANHILVGIPEEFTAHRNLKNYVKSVLSDDAKTYLITVPVGILMATLYVGWGAFAALLLALTLFLFGASLEDLARLSSRLALRTQYLAALNRIGRQVVGRGVDLDFFEFVERECSRAIKDASVAIGILHTEEVAWIDAPDLPEGGMESINLEVCEYFADRSLRRGKPLSRQMISKEELAAARTNRRSKTNHYLWFGTFQNRFLIRSLLAVPIRVGKRNIGVMVLQRPDKSAFGGRTTDFSITIAHQIATVIENHRLYREQLEKRHLEDELKTAREIQQRLLPERIPQLALFELAATSIPSMQVGGDYYDFVLLDPDHLAIVIADVTGKGIPGAILMSNLQAGVRTLALGDHSVIYSVSSLNDTLCGSTEAHQFATMFYAVLEIENGRISYCNAGHNPPLLLKANGDVIWMETGGPLLGVFPNLDYELGQYTFLSGDTLLLYTDGLVEAENEEGTEYGEQRLADLIRENRTRTAEQLKSLIVEDVRGFQTSTLQQDDMAIVVLKRK